MAQQLGNPRHAQGGARDRGPTEPDPLEPSGLDLSDSSTVLGNLLPEANPPDDPSALAAARLGAFTEVSCPDTGASRLVATSPAALAASARPASWNKRQKRCSLNYSAGFGLIGGHRAVVIHQFGSWRRAGRGRGYCSTGWGYQTSRPSTGTCALKGRQPDPYSTGWAGAAHSSVRRFLISGWQLRPSGQGAIGSGTPDPKLKKPQATAPWRYPT